SRFSSVRRCEPAQRAERRNASPNVPRHSKVGYELGSTGCRTRSRMIGRTSCGSWSFRAYCERCSDFGRLVDALNIPLLKALVLVPITLLPIINPLSTAPVFIATVGADRDLAKRLARQVAINAWFVVVLSILIGTYVLDLFGISLPVVRVG